MVKIHLAVAAPGQLFQRFGIVFVAVRLQLGRLGHDGCQLFGCGHVGLVLALFLFALALFQVGALLQRADAHHKEFVQIGTVDGQEFDLLGKGHVLVLAKSQDPAVEVQPAQFPVDKMVSSLIFIPLYGALRHRLCRCAHICLPFPGGYDLLRQARHRCGVGNTGKRPVLLPVLDQCPGAAGPDPRQGAQGVGIRRVQVHIPVLRQRCAVRRQLLL